MARIKTKFRYEEIYAGSDDGRGGIQTQKKRQQFFSIFSIFSIFGGGRNKGNGTKVKEKPVKAQSFLVREMQREVLEAPGTNL